MLLFLSFIILQYVAVKICGGKRIRHLESESDFEDFKLAVLETDYIRNAVKSFHLDKTTGNIFDELLRAASISEFIDISEKYRIPIQRLLYEWNYVPTEDSPKHILNALNDDCIQQILQKLSDPSDFLSAAETCRRFQANALLCYPRSFKHLSLSAENESNERFCWKCCKRVGFHLKHTSNFLKIFGHLIRTIELISDFEDDTLNVIVENCGETLLSIAIRGHKNTKGNFDVLSQFKALKRICIHSLSMGNVELPENLESIHLSDIKLEADLQGVMKKFSKLKYADFDGVYNLSDTMFNAFLKLNPQIELLQINGKHNMSFAAIDSISDHLPNLENMTIDFNMLSTHEYNEIVMHFSRFKQLRNLAIFVDPLLYISADTLIDSLVVCSPSIESLFLIGLHDLDNSLPGLLQLLQLKLLNCRVCDISPNTILQLVKASPTLERITFDTNTMSASELMDILAYSKNLIRIGIRIIEMDISLSDYNAMVSMIKGRLEVKLQIRDGNIDENIFKQNMQRLKITKEYTNFW